jgi:hypothetical protein
LLAFADVDLVRVIYLGNDFFANGLKDISDSDWFRSCSVQPSMLLVQFKFTIFRK